MKKYAFNIGMPNIWPPTKLLLIMKLIIVLLFAGLMQVGAAGFAQKVTLNQRGLLLKEALKEIRLQSGYNILYNADLLKNTTRINVNLKDASIDEALRSIFNDQKISYTIKENTVILERKMPSFLDGIIHRCTWPHFG
jgi:hypothetical protein